MRELDVADRYEQDIIRQFGEGVVVWRQDFPSALSDASIVAVVAGEDGPDMVCVEAHTGAQGSVYTKVSAFPVDALEAKIPLREWFYHRLEPENGNDAELVMNAAGGFLHGIWTTGSTGHHTYLGRVQRPGESTKRLIAATLARNGSDREVSIGLDVEITPFIEQVRLATARSIAPR